MPAANCTDPVVITIDKDNGLMHFHVEIAWNGTSTPPNCDGTVSGLFWDNQSAGVWYAHLPVTRLGPAVYRFDKGAVGSVTDRATLHAGGFDTRSDVNDYLDISQVPPQQGERLLN